MPRYTVAICHLNMVDTVEESIWSIYENTNEEFELLVIDDGSTDGSREVLGRLTEEIDRLRVVDCENKNIAQARNRSIAEAQGEYVLHQLDADDRYGDGIIDFCEIFRALEEATNRDVYLRGSNIHLAKRGLLQRVPYRDVGYGEDLDLWRRMDADPNVKMIWLRHRPFCDQIGYERGLLDYAKVRYSTAKVNFQTGIHPLSYVRWMVKELTPGEPKTRPWYGALFHICITPFAYLDSLHAGHLNNTRLPEEYREFDWYMQHILGRTTTFKELVDRYGLPIGEEDLTEAGRRTFAKEPLPPPEETVP